MVFCADRAIDDDSGDEEARRKPHCYPSYAVFAHDRSLRYDQVVR